MLPEHYPYIKQKLKEGDKIETSPKWQKKIIRKVIYTNGGILIHNEWFRWDYFFQVNLIININKYYQNEKIVEQSEEF